MPAAVIHDLFFFKFQHIVSSKVLTDFVEQRVLSSLARCFLMQCHSAPFKTPFGIRGFGWRDH